MQPRQPTQITVLVAQAQEKMRELKELQFFGGDALQLKRFKQTVTIPDDFDDHCWSVVITPDNPATCMPFSARTRPSNPTSYAQAQIEPVPRTDGAFQYYFLASGGIDVTRDLDIIIEYAGEANITVTQLG